jgi:hypothetical protein
MFLLFGLTPAYYYTLLFYLLLVWSMYPSLASYNIVPGVRTQHNLFCIVMARHNGPSDQSEAAQLR